MLTIQTQHAPKYKNTQSIHEKQKHKLRNTKAQAQKHKPICLCLLETHIQAHLEIKHNSKLKIMVYKIGHNLPIG